MRKPIHIFFFLLLALASCKSCDREEVKPDPCKSRRLPVLADFKMCVDYDTGAGRAFFEVTDTTAHQQLVFVASDTTGDIYEWQIGNEEKPRYGKTVSVYFRDQPVGGPNAIYPFKVKLTVKRTKNTCKVDSVATKERNFVLEAKERTFKKWRGNYIAHYTYAPNETFPLRIFDSIRIVKGGTGPDLIFNCLNIKYIKKNCNVPVRLEFYGEQYTSASPADDLQMESTRFCYPDTGYWSINTSRCYYCRSYIFFSENGRILNLQYYRQPLLRNSQGFQVIPGPLTLYTVKAYKL